MKIFSVRPAWFPFLIISGACGSGAELHVGLSEFDGGDAEGGVSSAVPDASAGNINVGDLPEASDRCASEQCDARRAVLPVCGDGLINQMSEVCDDGNTVSGDGCTGNCTQIEADFVCPTPGVRCVSTVKCGDGKIAAGFETCDDGNTMPGDGCDGSCAIETGWVCVAPAVPCTAVCGDGLIRGREECEFYGGAKPAAGNGCTAECTIEPHWDCDALNKTCARTICGNKIVERGEQCDDGNDVPFDGCDHCLAEPQCTGGACLAVCGDGKRYSTEDCDDGNVRDGDGCSHDCRIEMGYACNDLTSAAADTIQLPAIFRDFIGAVKGDEPQRRTNALVATRMAAGVSIHPDFNVFYGTGIQGVLEPRLGSDGRPVYVVPNNPGEKAPNFTGKANFDQWYRNDPAVNRVVVGALSLLRTAQGQYLFDSPGVFGPVDNQGFVPDLDAHATCANHNYSFTTETHFWFEYGGGEQFDFSGDDDVWVFVADTLVIDLGGLHQKLTASFTLDPMNGVAHVTSDLVGGDIDLHLQLGSVFQVSMFHAEREECESNFKLTLKDFNRPRSSCGPVCGDGIVTRTEQCDDGVERNVGAHGGCNANCTRASYCGDGRIDVPDEQCDDGVNLSAYGGCAPGCVLGPVCGDGIVQSKFEQCDDGVLAGGYGQCGPGCALGPRCGDGVVQPDHGEECDDGMNAVGSGCNPDCRFTLVR